MEQKEIVKMCISTDYRKKMSCAGQHLHLGINLGNRSLKHCERPAIVTLQCRVYSDIGHVVFTMMIAVLTRVMLNLVGSSNRSFVSYNMSI